MADAKTTAIEFEKVFGEKPDIVVSAPGRVNLIGEHTDYNDGWVLPMAIERRIFAAGKKTQGKIELSSADMSEKIGVDLAIRKTHSWADYPLGVIYTMRESGCKNCSAKIHFHGDVPLGGGLSSSAAIEVATAFLIAELLSLPYNKVELARISQLAENNFVGMKCGIMDQMASALSVENTCLFIDCADLSYRTVDFKIGDYKVVIVNSGVKRELAGSAYNTRRKECGQAAKSLGLKSLRDASIDMLAKIEALPDPVNRRAKHVVTENDRTNRAVEYLAQNKLARFGALMNESHESLRRDYEVSIPELDFIVDSLRSINGVLGARLTGAGFGGCVVALADSNAVSQMEKRALEPYKNKFDFSPSLMTTAPAGGVRLEKI